MKNTLINFTGNRTKYCLIFLILAFSACENDSDEIMPELDVNLSEVL